MDPISALGLACNILDLVGTAINCGLAVAQVYSSVDGLQRAHKTVDNEAKSLEQVVFHLQDSYARLPGVTVDDKILTISKRIVGQSLKLQQILHDCRSKKKGHLLSAVIATSRSAINNGKIIQHQKDLESSRKELNMWILVETRYSTRETLETNEIANSY
jgi:hypothetical protein